MKKRNLFLLLTAICPFTGTAQDSQPKPTTENDTIWYCISTPQRENLSITNCGENANLVGTRITYADNQLWCFIALSDGKFNLLNREGGLFMADQPTGKYYTATKEQPGTGFALSEVQDGLYNLADAQGDLVNLCLADQGHQLTPYNVSTDAGNLFRLEEVNPDNAAFELAKSQALAFYEKSVEGNAPGTFPASSRESFVAAVNQATSVSEVDAALTAYKSAVNTVKENTYYFIVSTGPNYCNGRILYNTKPTAGASQRWGDKTIDENALWEFIAGDGDTPTYKIRNKATGLYLTATSTPGGSGEVKGANEPGDDGSFELEPLFENASFLLYTPGGNPVHAQQNYGVVVTWNSRDYGSASSWQIVPATTDELSRAANKAKEDTTEYQLVWNDEFDEDAVDTGKWGLGEGFQRNNEAQWYQADNAEIIDGNLVIEARKERRPNPWYEAGSSDWKKSREYIDYTSSILTSSGKYDFCYGRMEVKAKIPCISGSWPAIWLLGNENVTGPWPSSGEIDVMEYYRDMTWANLVWGSEAQWAGIWESRNTPVTNYWVKQNPNWKDEYHIWRMDWDEESIKLYLDDELITICDLERTVNQGIWHLVDNPFHTNQYILLNLALGGNNGGAIDDSQLPFQYLVDYVRVYQKPNQIVGIMRPTQGTDGKLVTMDTQGGILNTTGFTGKINVMVYDINGHRVLHRQGDSSPAGISLELNNLEPGTYIVKATDSKTTRTQKLHISK